MTDDFDIDALLDAPLKKAVPHPPPPSSFTSVMDVIGQVKRETQVQRENDPRHNHRNNRQSSKSYRSRSPRSRSPEYRSRDRYGKYDKYDKSDKYEKYESSHREGLPKEVPLTESQRDRRTVFVRQLAQRVRSSDLKEFCEKAGPVRDAKLVYDKISGRSKGVAYVEFYEESSVQKGIALTGEKLMGIPIIIELTETEKNRIAEEAAEALRLEKLMASRDSNQLGALPVRQPPAKVFVGGLHQSLGEHELKKVFQPFGDIHSINIPKDNEGHSKGFAYIEFRQESDAKLAVDQMNGFELVGKPIRVGIVKDEYSKLPAESQGASSGAFSSLDDSETVGLSMNAKARTELMLKLSRDSTIMSRPSGPTQTILLKHMYDPEEETEFNWECAISDEVRDECNKYGSVVHLNVTKGKDGEVYVKFSDISGAQTAINALDGRWFGGKQVKAIYVRPEEYHRLFPNAA